MINFLKNKGVLPSLLIILILSTSCSKNGDSLDDPGTTDNQTPSTRDSDNQNNSKDTYENNTGENNTDENNTTVCQHTCVKDCQEEGGIIRSGSCQDSALQCCDFQDTTPDIDSDTGTQAPSNQGLTIYYIRHAETVANTLPYEEITLESASQFSELGHTQVQELTQWLLTSDMPVPDKVLVSPTWRGQHTISPYLVQQNLTGEIWPELTEAASADPTGEPVPVEFTPEQYLRYEIETANLEYRAGASTNAYYPQTYEQGLTMVMWLRDRILEEYSQSGKIIFVIGHAHAGRMLLGLLEGHDMLQSNPSYPLFNTGVTHVEQDPETSAFTVINQNINNPTGAPTWGR